MSDSLAEWLINDKFRCIQCSRSAPGITVHDFKFDATHPVRIPHAQVDWQFCPNCALMYAEHKLDQRTIEKIRQIAGETFLTHEACYNEEQLQSLADSQIEELTKEHNKYLHDLARDRIE